MARKPKDGTTEMVITEISMGVVEACILGTTPLIYNAMSNKVMRSLLLPSRKKTKAEREQTLKHDPIQEYRDSVYKRQEKEKGPTRLLLPSINFKAAITEAAGRVEGASKAEIKQLVWVQDLMVDVYGVPELFMKPVRSADMNRTPDIRTRAILPEWACKISLQYVRPPLTQHAIGNLLAAAGAMMGVGDWRQQKGSGNYGQFNIVPENDPKYRKIMKQGGMQDQDIALENPDYYDQETRELFEWFVEEVTKRRDEGYRLGAATAERKKRKPRGNSGDHAAV